MKLQDNLLQKILDDQATCLAAKGYTELALKSFHRPGTFLSKLEEELAVSIMLGLSKPEPRRFSVYQTGYFLGDQDVVDFKFDYEYRPAMRNLYLISLIVHLEHGIHEYPIGWIDTDLPTAKEAHSRLTYDFTRIVDPNQSDQQIQERTELATRLWDQQHDLLKSKGYLTERSPDPGIKRPLSDPFHRRLVECLRDPFLEKVGPFFIAPATARFDHKEVVNFRILYRASPPKKSIRPIALQARLDSETYTTIFRSLQFMPSANSVFLALFKKTILEAARNIEQMHASETPLPVPIRHNLA